ncbi:MAG: hypothetical protein KME26_32725 [Oscillatoria princeps RMCB-10]|nr:hypothetical protein [Oscillatoria princeps RMCB-10]
MENWAEVVPVRRRKDTRPWGQTVPCGRVLRERLPSRSLGQASRLSYVLT